MEEGLTHLNTAGEVHMVDVGDRLPTKREATAMGCLQMQPTTLELIRSGNTPKGDLLAVARIAAIQAAKRTWELIPLCHQLPLSGVEVTIEQDSSSTGTHPVLPVQHNKQHGCGDGIHGSSVHWITHALRHAQVH